MVKRLSLIVPALTASGFPLEAATRVLELNPEMSAVVFTVGSTLHTVEGTTYSEEGFIRFDLERGEVPLQVRGNLGQ